MPWWHNLSPSPSPSSSSPKSSAKRRLTRIRKLRHVNDFEGLVKLSCSPILDHFSSAMVPQPLPLPELPAISRRQSSEGFATSGFGDCPLPSPEEASSRGTEERARGEVVFGEEIPSNASIANRRKNLKYVGSQLSKTVSQDLNGVESSQDRFRVSVPVRSAPTSPFSSRAVSPQRTNTGELCPYYVVPKANQVWSDPEMPFIDMISGPPPPAFLDQNAFSTDSSPLYSPQVKSPRLNCRSPSGPASPLHPRLSLETSTVWRESNGHANVHPLPLPPGATLPSPSVPISQVATKLESLPMKSQWQKGKLIGRGTFGSVYVASNRETGALCAMKEVELFPDDSKSAECIKQLEQEIKVLSQLKHQNIVQYYGSEILEDRFYIYLEYVHPGSINTYIREHCEAITESVVRNFTRHILSGLAYLHSTKTIHRDIKGANLLVDASGVVKLADFGMAKHDTILNMPIVTAWSKKCDYFGLVLSGQVSYLSLKGSPYWMAPELMQSVMQKDASSDLALAVDIWSLGCTIIEMFTGKPPWSEYEGAAAMFKVMKDTPPIPETLSSEGKDFLRCCFRRNPAERPSAAKLLEHCFLKNSLQMSVLSCTQSFNGMKLMDTPYSPRERSENKLDQLPLFPSVQYARGKVASDSFMHFSSETGQQSHHETSGLAVAPRYSPRSTLETLPSLSPPRSGDRKHCPGPSASVPSSINHATKMNRIFR